MKPYLRFLLAGWMACGAIFPAPGVFAADRDQVVIQYDCIPNYANWGAVTAAYKAKTGVTVPPDMKGSSAALAALEAEKRNPQADTAYYSGAIGVVAGERGLHEPYRPRGWEKIPNDLKDPEGRWFTVHSAAIAFIVNKSALGSRPVPRTWQDLLKEEYRGLIAYDDPTWGGTSYTMLYGLNILLGGDRNNFEPVLDYLRRLDRNVAHYPRESIYNDVLRGEIPIWINADGNGLKMKHIDGGNIEVVIPQDGSVSMPLVMGLVRGAPRAEAAKRYLDWLLTPEAQGLFAEAFFMPVMADALTKELARKFPSRDDYGRVIHLNLRDMAEASERLKRAWLGAVRR